MKTRRLHLPAAVLAVLGIGLETAAAREPAGTEAATAGPVRAVAAIAGSAAAVAGIDELSRPAADRCGPTRIIEEIIVDGSDAAAAHRANQARFEAEMALFARTVQARYRDAVRERLERAVRTIHGEATGIAGSPESGGRESGIRG